MSLLPTNREIAPPRPLVDEPVLIVTDPELTLLAPEEMATSPEPDAVVNIVAPVSIVTPPELKLVALLAAVCIAIAPDAPVVAEPLVTCTAPPTLLADAPAVKLITLPAPLVLLPTDTLMAPPTANSEEPLVMEIAPAAPLLAPDSKDRDPEEKLAVAVLAPVAIEMEPVFLLAATPSAD